MEYLKKCKIFYDNEMEYIYYIKYYIKLNFINFIKAYKILRWKLSNIPQHWNGIWVKK